MSIINKAHFSGSSGAILEVIVHESIPYVRKSSYVAPKKLEEQYNWLKHNQAFSLIPDVTNFQAASGYASYMLPYYKDHLTLSNKIKLSTNDEIKITLNKLLTELENNFYQKKMLATCNTNDLDEYLKSKFQDKLLECQHILGNESITKSEVLVINGIEYNQISKKQEYLKSLELHEKIQFNTEMFSIHGDLTAENILINDQLEFKLIDPNSENNIINSISQDLSKLFQSFNSYYELYDENISIEIVGNEINYRTLTDIKYDYAASFLYDEIYRRFHISKEELIFHEIVHIARLLPYKLKQSYSLFLLYYSKLIELNHLLYSTLK